MKKIVIICMILLLSISVAACGQSKGSEETDIPVAEEGSLAAAKEADASKAEKRGAGNILIAYFSYGENAELPESIDASASASIQLFEGHVTGNTGLIAHYIQNAAGGELFSIQTAEKYAPDYDSVVQQGQAEKNENRKPKIATHIEDLDSYDTVFIGFPNWWYGMPMVMYSFFDEYDFSGKTIVPFCTSGGSAFSDAIDEMKQLEPDAVLLDGLHIDASSAAGAESTVKEWVSKLGLSVSK